MTNKILLFLITCCFIGIILSCLATKPSFGLPSATVSIPHNEIEITFDPFQEEIIPIVSIVIPHNEIEIIYISDK